MKFLVNFILYLYLFLPSSAFTGYRVKFKTNTTPDEYSTSSETSESTVLSGQDAETTNKDSVLYKMLVITNNKNGCGCNSTAKDAQQTTTEKYRPILGFKVIMRNKPEKYTVNNSISRLCPYFVPNEGFKMYKMAAVYWSKFYNLKQNLNCFRIKVIRLSASEMEENELKYGNFDGKVDWTQCHFEIKPPKLFFSRRHFLMGGIDDHGVMRNIMISYDPNGGFTFEEESPDQWLMLRNLVVLRDCWTGEVVVFTRSRQQTSTETIVQALRSIGEEMVGKILCDEDDDY